MPLEGAPLTPPTHLLDAVLRVGLDAVPDGVALASADGEISWRALDLASTRLASGYHELGIAAGDRVASLMPNRADVIVHYLACLKSGIVAVPLNYRYTPPEIDHALEVSGATMLLAHAERADDLAATSRVGRLPLGSVGYGEASSVHAAFEELVTAEPADLAVPDPAAAAVIFFTSGSTGPAKGVTHSLETFTWVVASAVAALETGPDDVFLPASSLAHIGGFGGSLAALYAGARAVVARTFDAAEVLMLLRRFRPTMLQMIPAALTALVRDHDVTRADFSSLRLCRAGGDAVSHELDVEVGALVGLRLDEGYGMTESGLAASNPVSGVIKEGSIGPATPGVSLSARDEQGEEVATGTVGRLWIRTRGCMLGYWGDRDATDRVVVDRWLDSGDLVSVDDDDYLWFFGRRKQIIVHDGSNISPLEVEGALDEHPDVALSGVVGIHDRFHGENVRGYVQLEPETRVTSQELIDFARARVGYKAPEEIVFIDAIPLNPTGKLDRVALARLAESHVNPDTSAS